MVLVRVFSTELTPDTFKRVSSSDAPAVEDCFARSIELYAIEEAAVVGGRAGPSDGIGWLSSRCFRNVAAVPKRA